MGVNIALLLLGLLCLIAGAEGLVRGSSSLAQRLGLTPLVVGLTVVAFGTSAPELVVSVQASLHAQGDIAVGNVVGSNIFNIGVILGITALICPLPVSLGVLKLDAPVAIVAALLAAWFLLAGSISALAGALLLSGLLVYVCFNLWLARRETSVEIASEFEAGIPRRSRSVYRDIFLIAGGLALLVAGSRLMVSAAVEIALALGVSEAVIALTVVAAGTSLPELATSVTAAIRRQPDIAVGNIVGSNIFNILGILGVASLVAPLKTTGLQPLDVWVMVGFMLLLFPLLWTDKKLLRWEGSVLLAAYVVYLAVLWP